MNKCEGRLSKQECWDALQPFGNNKSPVNDDLSKEFYVCLINKINACQLSTSQKQPMITLIEKKGKEDKQYLKNWRPTQCPKKTPDI